MEGKLNQKKGFIILAIGIIMLIFILFSKIKNNLVGKDTTVSNNVTIQTEILDIDENADYLNPIKKYFYALQQKNADEIVSLFPDFANFTTSYMQQQIDYAYNSFESECGKNVKISYNIQSGEKYNKETIKAFENDLKNNYSNYDKTITELYKMKISIKISGDAGIAEKEMYICVGEIDNKWYIF